MAILGPQGTGERFKNKVAQLIAKGMPEVRARRIASGTNVQKSRKK